MIAKNNIFLAILLISCLISASLAFSAKGKAKAAQLRELANKSPEGIIKLNATGYRYYVMEAPRPYDLVVFFTANSCKYCDEMMGEYQQVAQFYKQAGALNAERVDKTQKRAVFFSIIYFSEEFREVFLELDFKSVPNVFVAHPQVAMISYQERQNYVKDFKWQISQTDGVVTSHKILEYINKKTERDIQHIVPISGVLLTLSVIGSIIGILFLLFRYCQFFFLNPKVWFVGSITIYAICSAGVIYNILHGVPLTTTDKHGNTEFFSTQNRTQLGAEGFIMSIAICSVGVLVILWNQLFKISWNTMVKRIIYMVLFATTILVVLFIEDVYRKQGWYNPNFYPPAHYIKGPLMRDQGNSI